MGENWDTVTRWEVDLLTGYMYIPLQLKYLGMDARRYAATVHSPYRRRTYTRLTLGEFAYSVQMRAWSALISPGFPLHEAADRSGEDPCSRPAISVDPNSDF